MAEQDEWAEVNPDLNALDNSDEDKEIIEQLTEEEKRRREELENSPMQASLKRLEKRWTKSGKSYLTEPKEEEEELPVEKVNWYDKFALCVVNEFDQSNSCITERWLQVNSLALRDILSNTIGAFPDVVFRKSSLAIDFPPRCLYHYLPEFEIELAKLEAEDAESDGAKHLLILIDFIKDHFHETLEETGDLLKDKLMSYDLLWTIFRPGIFIYNIQRSQPRVYKLLRYSYHRTMYGNYMELDAEFVDFDGNDFGTRTQTLKIKEYEGPSSIARLPVLPLTFHPNEDAVRERLIKRGRKWEAHAGQHFCHYKGIGIEGGKYMIDSRIMIDVATHQRVEGGHGSVTPFDGERKYLDDGEDEAKKASKEPLPLLTDDQCLMASPSVFGFSMTEKKWFEFFIDNVSPIDWNTKCFEQLVLPESQKELVQALVTEHTKRSDSDDSAFEDIVKGKSRGLILVLHGPPGVGKTLTAECVAEFCKRPLYSVSSGDLGTDSYDLESRLNRILDLATTWKAVLLIDEADVFLERRSLHDMQRNGLVSIFLRILEYYAGILFMTTNRVHTFDDAFKSRIHVPLKYRELPPESRERIWRHFVTSAGDGTCEDVGDEGYAELALAQLNGRQIKNVVRTAKTLAAYKGRKMDLQQLRQVMEIQMEFERDLNAMEGDDDHVET